MEYPWPLVQDLLLVGVVMDLLVRLFGQENCSERLLRVLFFLAQLHCSKFKLQFKKYASLVRVEIPSCFVPRLQWHPAKGNRKDWT